MGAEVLIVREWRMIAPRLGAEALIASEWRAIVPRLGAGLFYYGRKVTDRFPFGWRSSYYGREATADLASIVKNW